MGQSLQSLKCIYANLQSIFSKKHDIDVYLDKNNIDIMMFTECWINNDHLVSEYLFSGFQPPTVALKNRGGSCIYVRNEISYTEIKPPSPMEDSCWIVIKTENNKDRLYAVVYRSPNSTTENNNKLLENLKWAKENFGEIVLVGDFNLPNIDWELESAVNNYDCAFVELLEDLGLQQLVNVPTRYREGQIPSLLDLLITSDENIVPNISYASPFGKSDHITVEFDIRNAYCNKKDEKYKYNFKKMNNTDFQAEMNTVNWMNVFTDDNDLCESYEFFNNFVHNTFESLAPEKKKGRVKHACWANRRIKKLSQKKRKAWDKYKYTKRDYDYQRYKETLVKFNDAKEEAIRNYEINIIANKKKDSKRYYKYVSQKDKYSNTKIVLKNGNEIITEDKECANMFNEYFSSVYTQGASLISDSHNSSLNVPNIDELTITRDMVRDKIMQLDPDKSTGPDGIPAYVLKTNIDIFVPILTKFFQLSYSKSKIPGILKSANIVPLHKDGDKSQASNYRPVSLTPIIAKIMERIVKDSIENHIKENDIISAQQHGFCKNKSTTTNLLEFWNNVTDYVEKSLSISIMYTDLRKAFDTVPHDLLIHKIRKYGISGKTCEWIKEFLNNRSQRVAVGNELSLSKQVESGVPQGAVLSGILFSLYVNDLPEALKFAQISMYADDAKIFAPIKSEQNIEQFQEDIDHLFAWCQTWRLRLNPQKCLLVQYNPRSTLRQYQPEYRINGTIVNKKSQTRDLGIIISEDMKFHNQVNSVCSRANKEIHRIRRCFITRTPSFLSNMFKTYVRPHMEYAVEVWSPSYIGDIKQMERVQNRMTKLLRHGNMMTPEERNEVLGLSTHEERRRRGDMIATFKNIDNPSLFTLRNNDRTRGNAKTIVTREYKHDIKRHSFNHRIVANWNSLPNFVVNSTSINSFKTNYDKYVS